MQVSKSLFFGGNWKAVMTPQMTRQFFQTFKAKIRQSGNTIADSGATIMIAPPSTSLIIASSEISTMMYKVGTASTLHANFLKLGVQDPWHRSGAYTGATTLEAAKELGVDYAVIGHSETREPWRIILNALKNVPGSPTDKEVLLSSLDAFILKELKIDSPKPASFRLALDAVINQLVIESLKVNIIPVICVGETLEERKAGQTNNVVLTQLNSALTGLSPQDIVKIIVAYEPVWAIGTGETATPEQAEEVHSSINDRLVKLTGNKDHEIPIIYGGSMNGKNVGELVSQPHISGGLIGGASLKPDVFMQLILNGIKAVS